jgi:phosphoribosylformylglycinamidine cyclo-ligase
MSAHGKDSYAAAGVDYDVIDRIKRLAQTAAHGTAPNLSAHGLSEVRASRGETAYVVDAGDFYLATVLECLGTKSLVADAMRPHLGRSSYDLIARDAVAAIVNDLAAVGATPAVVNAYFAVGSGDWFADADRASDLIRGWSEACHDAGAAWGGGESPALGGIIAPGAIDLAGSAVGIVRPKERLIQPDRIHPGDAIVLIESTGIHTNGLSLARSVAANLERGYLTRLPNGRSFGEALLDPSPLYAGLVGDVQAAGVDVHYLVHITGHGWRKLMRAERSLTYAIDKVPDVPAVLDFLYQAAGMPEAEAYGTFNMGAGFAFYVSPDDAPTVVAASQKRGLAATIAGQVEEGPRRVAIRPLGIEFLGESLQIR